MLKIHAPEWCGRALGKFAGAAPVFAVAAVWAFRSASPSLGIGAFLACVCACCFLRLGAPFPDRTHQTSSPALFASLGEYVAVIAFVLSSAALTRYWYSHLALASGVFFFCAGWVYFALRRSESAMGVGQRSFLSSTDYLIIFALLAAGGFLRIVGLDSFPPSKGLESIEEAQAVRDAFSVLRAGASPWVWIQTTYMGALFMKLFGEGLRSIRLMSAVYATITLVPFYLLAREIVGRGPAVFASALLATSAWHLGFSRFGHNVYHGIFFCTLGLLVFVRGVKHPSKSAGFLSGFLAGLQIFDYDGSKWPPVVFVLAAIFLIVVRRDARPAFVRFGAWMLLAILVCAVPNLYFAYADPHWFFSGPLRMVAGQGSGYYDLSSPTFWSRRISRLVDLLNFYTSNPTGTSYARMFAIDEPVLDIATFGMFLLGIAFTLSALRRAPFALLLGIFLLLTYGGGLAHDIFDVQRICGVIVPVYLFVAIGGAIFGQLVTPLVRPLLWLVVGLYAGAVNVDKYERFSSNVVVRSGFYDHYSVLMSSLSRLNAETDFAIIVTRYPRNILLLNDYSWMLKKPLEGVVTPDLLQVTDLLARAPAAKKSFIFVQKPYDLESAASYLRKVAGVGECSVDREPELKDFAVLMCEHVNKLEGPLDVGSWSASYAQGAGISSNLKLERAEPFIDLATLPQALLPSANLREGELLNGVWKGRIQLCRDLPQAQFQLSGLAQTSSLLVDDQPWSLEEKKMLSAGNHSVVLSVSWAASNDGGIRLELFEDREGARVKQPLQLYSGADCATR